MADGVGLSVGATNLTAVVVGRAAVTRSAVVTLFPNRPPEVGVPSENPQLNSNERGLIFTDFVDRVGDPVGIVASDGSTHRAETLLAEALRSMLYAVSNGRAPADPVAVTHPAHWRPDTVEALRKALATVPEFGGPKPVSLIPDATAALTALQDDPGLPTRGAIALCDFGGSGTSITVVDAANGYQPVGPTVRHTELSGDLIDQALLTHVLNGLTEAGSIDLSSTSAIGSLTRLRRQSRAAKEQLSTAAVTSLGAELPGYAGDVRLTRNELDDAIEQPLTDFVRVLQETVDRSGPGAGALAAVASAGGSARLPIVTTTLSEHFRVPVVTTPQPELTPAIGAGLRAVRPADEGMTAMAGAPAAAAAGAATQMAPEVGQEEMASSTFRALAWSDADHIPDVVAPTDPYDYTGMADTEDMGGPRPPMQFAEPETDQYEAAPLPWYRRPGALLALGLIALLAALVAAWWFLLRDDGGPTQTPTTEPVTTTSLAPTPTSVAPPPPPPPPPPVTRTVAPPRRTVTQAPTAPPPPPPPPASEEPPPPPPPSPEPTQPPTQQPIIPTLPYPTIPGLPFVPNPIPQPQQPPAN
jgi:actin-like ATPase involved in cell morphogenesis